MISPLFYLFSFLMIIGGLMVVFMKNPVSSALSMVLSFIGLAGLFIGLNAYFVGVLQILVYAGAIMVLFIFIIMLLDLKEEAKHPRKGAALAAGIIIPAIILIQLTGVLTSTSYPSEAPELQLQEAAENYQKNSIIHQRLADKRLPDVHLIGRKLFTEYNFPLQIVAVLLLVATVGCIALSKKQSPAVAKKIATESIALIEQPSSPVKEKSEIQEPAPQAVVETPVEKIVEEPIEQPVKEVMQEPSTQELSSHDNRGHVYTSKPSDADDLKQISGVGPVIEKKLNDFGIYTFKQIAEWSETNIEEFDQLLTFKGRIARDNWLSQAADLNSQKNV
ncbi:MAG: NADH-quinone oxidoreductase subunit J [Akkermansiaceae bacterium]